MFQLDIKFQWHHKLENTHKRKPLKKTKHSQCTIRIDFIHRPFAGVVQYLKITRHFDGMPQISCE